MQALSRQCAAGQRRLCDADLRLSGVRRIRDDRCSQRQWLDRRRPGDDGEPAGIQARRRRRYSHILRAAGGGEAEDGGARLIGYLICALTKARASSASANHSFSVVGSMVTHSFLTRPTPVENRRPFFDLINQSTRASGSFRSSRPLVNDAKIFPLTLRAFDPNPFEWPAAGLPA